MLPEVPNASELLAFVSELCSEQLCLQVQSLNKGLTPEPFSARLDACPSPRDTWVQHPPPTLAPGRVDDHASVLPSLQRVGQLLGEGSL